jgi:protein tyrosine/serine phosphatase
MPYDATRIDLEQPFDRFFALTDMTWRDHAYFRVWWQNAHWISGEMVRSNQPWPHQLRDWSARGIRSVVNLRGGLQTSFHHLEQDACARHGLTLHNFSVTSRGAPTREQLHGAKRLFDSLEYPALMHCKSGADRVGLMSVLYLHFRQGEPIAQATRMLSRRYGHFNSSKTGILDRFFADYLAHSRESGLSLLDWVDQVYDPVQLKKTYRSTWIGDVLADKLLRRE